MGLAVKATYDGKVLIPERPLDLRVGEVIQLTIRGANDRGPLREEIEHRLTLHRAASGVLMGPTLPDGALSRESIYETRV